MPDTLQRVLTSAMQDNFQESSPLGGVCAQDKHASREQNEPVFVFQGHAAEASNQRVATTFPSDHGMVFGASDD